MQTMPHHFFDKGSCHYRKSRETTGGFTSNIHAFLVPVSRVKPRPTVRVIVEIRKLQNLISPMLSLYQTSVVLSGLVVSKFGI